MAAQRQYVYADLANFPDDNLRREILDGELIVSPAPRMRHQAVLARLHLVIGNHVEEHGGGEVYFAPVDVVFEDRNVCEPDLLLISDEQREIVNEKNVSGSPRLVVEVLSDPRIDRVRKREIYARFGVPEYWIVDPDADRIEVYLLGESGYGKPELFELGETVSTPALPGLEIDLTRLFRR